MSSSNPKVACVVEQCTHWMPGNQCMAAKIAIYNDESAGTSESQGDTQCKSFHSGQGMADYVGALHNANVGGTLKAAFEDGIQITPSVECYVGNCKYWQQGNYCNAQSIDVQGRQAAKPGDTDCATFESQ